MRRIYGDLSILSQVLNIDSVGMQGFYIMALKCLKSSHLALQCSHIKLQDWATARICIVFCEGEKSSRRHVLSVAVGTVCIRLSKQDDLRTSPR